MSDRLPSHGLPGGGELDEIHAREQAFHDALAAEHEVAPPRAPDPWERALLEAAGPIAGLRVLELGCGDGEVTLQLIDAGTAEITALDISPEMVALSQRRLEQFRPGASVRHVVAPAEATGLEPDSFDLIVGKWVLHHLDYERGVAEAKRVLRPGGRAVFIETSALNPFLRAVRSRLVGRLGIQRVGTPDEHPLTEADLDLLRREFASCHVDHPNFVLFHLFARNVLRFRWRKPSRALFLLDRFIGRRLPRLGRLSYYLRIVVEK